MQVGQQDDNEENFWFPTPENFGNESDDSTIQKRILKELSELDELGKLDAKENEESRANFLPKFNRADSLITGEDREILESAIKHFNYIFARHRHDIGTNTQLKVSLTAKDDKPVYTQSLAVPINLKEDLTVELALMHRYGVITTLPFSNMQAPSLQSTEMHAKTTGGFAEDQHIIPNDYINNYQISTLSDAAQPLSRKKMFCKLDCSQDHHCLQKADQSLIELLAFNFASETFFKNIRAVLKSIEKAGLKLTVEKFHSGVTQGEFLGRSITPNKVAPQDYKFNTFLSKVRFPKSKKQV